MYSTHIRRNSSSLRKAHEVDDHDTFKAVALLLSALASEAAGALVTIPLIDTLETPRGSPATTSTQPPLKLPQPPKGSKYWKKSRTHDFSTKPKDHAHILRIDDAHVLYTYCEIFTIPEENTDGTHECHVDDLFDCRITTEVCDE